MREYLVIDESFGETTILSFNSMEKLKEECSTLDPAYLKAYEVVKELKISKTIVVEVE